eukprot:m.1529821 g.1529821  ORF g.1529821 m.1529821 type:complete len:569 (-) comp25239_c2_seq7:10771-12477(-)
MERMAIGVIWIVIVVPDSLAMRYRMQSTDLLSHVLVDVVHLDAQCHDQFLHCGVLPPTGVNISMYICRYFASIGVDWLKEDSCYDTGESAVAIQHYAKLRDALNATGRRIWYALCGWEPFYASDPTAGNKLANSARIGPDTGSGWAAVLKNVDNTHGIGQYAGAQSSGGYWNDGSLQLSPGTGCSSSTPACANDTMCASPLTCVDGVCQGPTTVPSATCMTQSRHRTMFSLWCVLGLNLVTTGNLPSIANNDRFTMATWANEEAIAVNQDAAAWSATRYGRRLDPYAPLVASLRNPRQPSDGSLPHARVAECGGEPALQQWVVGTASNYTLQCTGALGGQLAIYAALDDCHTDIVYDGCTFDPTVETCAGRGNYTHFQFDLGSDGALRSRYLRGYCITYRPSDEAVIAAPCGAPLSQDQQWHYVNKQLMPGNTSKCLTAGTTPPPASNATTAVFGRPLTALTTPTHGASPAENATAGGAYAVLLLNNGAAATNVTCDRACVANMQLPTAFPATAYVRDLWAHSALSPVADIRAGLTLPVAGGGASRLLKLCTTAVECSTPATLRNRQN